MEKYIAAGEKFQEGNAPAHTVAHGREWFLENMVSLLPWPTRSPDLNPIEKAFGAFLQERCVRECASI